MTRPTILLAVGCLLAPMAAHAQAPGWDATFFVDPFPSPYLSDWEMNPTMATLTVTNGTGQDADVTVRLSLTDGQGREVIRSRSDPLFIAAGAPETFHTGSALTGTSSYDTAIEDQIARTGRFPEGDYTLCVSVTDGAGFMLVDNRCEFFSTYFPDPPYLLFPMDGDTVELGDPIFEWTPVQVPVGFDVRYVFQLAELLPGQEPHTALTSGILHFEDAVGFNPSLTYPLGALPLDDGRRYAWWVQALDPNGLPVSSNQGRSEIWTFTHDGEGEDDGGEQIGSSLHGRIVAPGPGVGGPLADLGTADFTSIRDALEELPDEEIPIPLPIGGVGAFDALALSNVSVEVDEVSRTVAISATASLPLGSVNVLLVGQWDGSGGPGSFALALEPLVFDLGEWVAGLEGTPLDEIDWSGGILTIADQARTLDAASLPPSVERFYGEPVVELEVGVALAHVLDLRDTALQEPLASLGLDADEAALTGTVGLDPTMLFGPVEERDAPELDLTATLRGARLADTPEWLNVQSYALRVTNEPDLSARVELGAEAQLGERTFPFTFALDLREDGDAPAVLTGRMTDPLEGPFDIDWLTLHDVRLTLTPAVEEGEASSAVLRGDLPLGERTVELTGVLEGSGEGMQATFTASLEELALSDFVSFAETALGGSPFGDGVPADFEAFRDLSLEIRSGDPPMFTALATVPFPGAGTEFMYTLVPTGGGPSSFARGLAAVRLSDWALSDMIPALEPTPLGGVPFPGLAMTWTHDLGIPEGGSGGGGGGGEDDDPEPVDPEPAPGPTPNGPAWSIHWPDLTGRAREFLAWAYPCLDDPTACPEPTPAPLPPDDPESPDGPGTGSGGIDWPDIDISGVFSLSDLADWVRSLIDFQPTPEPGPLPPPDPEPAPGDDDARIRGFPGISIDDLLDGLPFEPVDLDIDIVLPPIPDGMIGLPDWFRVEGRTLRLVGDPEIRMIAETVVEADLEGPKIFHLSADVTNAEGGGAALEGLMEGAWSQPFGLTWLTLDSVHMAVGAGSVGPRVALGSTLAIGNVDAALGLDVRGPAEDRSIDFTARAANLSTRDVALFLNDAFDAGLAVPESELTLDSLSVAFSTGDAEAFHLTGGFSAGLDAREAMVALSGMLPGLTVPDDLPFELGTLGSTWFDLHVVADSMWGGYGGRVALGEQESVASLEGSARVEFGAPRPTGDPWVTLEMDVAGRDLVSDDVIEVVAAAVRNDWEIPEQLEAVGTVALDSVRARVAMDTRTATASGELSGAGSFDGDAGALEASVDVGFFVEPEAPWARGTLGLELRDVPMSQALAEAAAALPGEWAIPDALSSMDPLHLDSASLALGFDSRTDSVSTSVRGAGTLGEADETQASAELTLVRTPADEWAVGRLAIGLRDASLPQALARAEELLAAEWTLPESVSGLDPVVLDSAALGVAFDSRTATFTSDLGGTAHLGEGTARMDGALDLALVSTADEAFARGGVTLGVRALDMTSVLDEVRALLPGDWSLPDGFTALDGFYLDDAELALGFDTRRDSLSARTLGSGRLGDAGAGFTATTDVTFLRLGDGSDVAGSVTLGRESLTMPQALDQVAALLPGEWALPDGFDAFDDVSLDRADFLLGFDTRTDSVFAAVSGAGGLDGLAAGARLDFLRLADDDRVSGAMTLDVGSVGAGEAIDRIGSLLPGEWALPDGFDSFDALTLQSASLTAGFDTGPDSLWAGFEGAGSLDGVGADASLGFQRVRGASGGSGLVTLDLGDVSLGDAFGRATSLLPGSWPVPEVDFPIGDLRDVRLQLGFDTPADSVWAGVDAAAVLAERDGRATLRALSVGGLAGTPRSWAEGTFRVDVGTVTLSEALELAASLAPGSVQVPDLDFDLGGIQEAVLEAGFRTGEEARTWAGISGGFQMGARTAQAEVEVALGSSTPEGRFRAAFDGGFGATDVVELMSGFMPGGAVELPPLGPLDVRLDQPTLTVRFGERPGVSFTGATTLFDKAGDALFSFSRIDGQPQLVLGVQVPDLGFGDLVPEFQNPITDQLNLSLAALTITRGQGTVSSDDLTEEERAFYFPLFGGSRGGRGSGDSEGSGPGGGATGGGSGFGGLGSFDVTLTPGLNLTGLVPLDGAGALKDMVDMLAPGGSDLTLTGNLPLPGFGGGGIRDLSLRAALPPMAPPGSPAWFVEGEVALQISGRPSVGLAGAMTLDVDGDTLTFDIESNVAVVPAGVELSIAGGLAAANPWVGPLGIDWLTLNEIRLAMGLNPVNVRLGFLGDAVIGSQDIRMALGTRLNLYTGVPMGALVLGETDEGLTLSDLQDFAQRVAGEGAEPLPITALPNMALRDLGVRVATYTDFDLGIEAGIGLRGAFLMQTGQGGELSEFGRIDLSVDREGIAGLADIGAWAIGPVAFDDALLDLALTREAQHLIIEGGATIDDAISGDVALSMTRDSLGFTTDFDLFDQFRAHLDARAGFALTSPSFQVRAALYPDFTDAVTYDVAGRLIPVGQQSLQTASVSLDAARQSLDAAEASLDAAVWLASEASRQAMNAAYTLYVTADNNFRVADSRYRYYAARCSWRSPGYCTARNYWRNVRAARLAQRTIRWSAYSAARTVYENREYLEDNPAVAQARTSLEDARFAFNTLQAEVDRYRVLVDDLADWIDAYESCPSCARPPMPVQVVSAEAAAALNGFFGRSSVDLTVGYRVFGDRRTFQAGFGGSISDLSQAVFQAVSDALF